ncbi:uncharacterized protein LOC129919940 [Episyrphus balteatus]|uniref:uncharacterized protein LOC129919940 n=1 Tax=Episyrphus balteatus TaxID=286459 RepID=UPI002485E522|nr:uncharacterized protein LOC129919940 [Episyrphus balteatus]
MVVQYIVISQKRVLQTYAQPAITELLIVLYAQQVGKWVMNLYGTNKKHPGYLIPFWVEGSCHSCLPVNAQFVNLTQYPGERCNAKCIKGQTRVCYFDWILEHYHALGPACGECQIGNTTDCFREQCIIGDGFQKGVMSINRQIPGPPMHLCHGDQVIVDVLNMAHGTSAAIHWHGLHMVQTPYSDGVPHISQCPITFESAFRYVFNATEPGTHFYHSHSGHHKLNGQYGALIIRQADEDNLHINKYNHDLSEHYILISDWRHDYAENSFPGIPQGAFYPDSLLINGRGTFIDRATRKRTNPVPPTIYYVKSGKYRFRLINSVSLTCYVTLQIQGHPMVVIASDSFNVEPFEIDTLVSNSGERYDFIIDANKGKGDYWIRIRGSEPCQAQPTDTFALLRYGTKETDPNNTTFPPLQPYDQVNPIGYSLNFGNATCFNNKSMDSCVADLTALEKDIDLVTKKPDYKFTFSFENHIINPKDAFIPGRYRRFDNPRADIMADGVVNNISLIFPPQPIYSQYSEVDKNLFCERSNCPEQCDGETTRECIHIIKVKTNSIVEMALHDQADVEFLHHPFHLHGFRFALMGMTNNTANLTSAIQSSGRYRKKRPVWKDTVSVPQNGVAVARFRADNPGIWLLHCHYELHLATGMAFIFQVGEPNEWVQVPEHFPQCRNYLPRVKKDAY